MAYSAPARPIKRHITVPAAPEVVPEQRALEPRAVHWHAATMGERPLRLARSTGKPALALGSAEQLAYRRLHLALLRVQRVRPMSAAQQTRTI